MSENIYESDKIIITSYFGGKHIGMCLQITPLEFHENGASFAHLTREEVEDILDVVLTWSKR